MKKHLILIFLLVLTFSHTAFSDGEVRLAVLDFRVQSDNPDYKYLGKGLAEFVTIEIMKSKDIVLIEREKRNKILEEMEFSLTDLADPEKQISVGKMLTANYLLTGNIYDFAGRLSITFELIATETSEIVLKEKVDGEIGNYDYLTASIARSIVDQFMLEVAEETVAKAEAKEEKAEDVLVSFSKAVDAYDKNEMEVAKKELKEAEKLDPGNTAVKVYLDKLILNTSKFKTITEQYYPAQNPAFLGIIQYDRFHLISVNNIMAANDAGGGWKTIEQSPDLVMHEIDTRFLFGYQLPIFDRMGLGVGYFLYNSRDEIFDPVNKPTDTSGRRGTGLMVSIGWNPVNFFSFGLGITLYAQIRKGFAESESGGSTEEYRDPTYFRQAFYGGFLIKNRNSSIIFDTFAGYSLEKILYFDPATFPNKRSEMEERGAPLFIENTLTFAFNERRTFFIVKQLNDIYLETGSYYGRLLPAFEHWLQKWLSVRAGIEGAVMKLGGDMSWGLGGTGGFTFRLGERGWEIDANVTYRRRPSRFIDGEYIDEILPFFTVSKSKNFVYR